MKNIKEKQIKKMTNNFQRNKLFKDKKTAQKVAEKCYDMHHDIDIKITENQMQKIMDTLDKNNQG